MKDGKNLIIVVLSVAVCIMAIAYAAFSQTLAVKTNGTITSSWGPLYITECSCMVSAAGITSPSATCTPILNEATSQVAGTISFTAYTPGDNATCTFTIRNNGTLIAATPTFTSTSSTNFAIEASNGTCIKPSSTGTFNTKVTFKSDVTSIPTSAEIQTVVATYTQGTTCA